MKPARFTFQAMGGRNELVFQGGDPGNVRDIARKIMADIRDLETCYSRYLAGSIISRINRLAGVEKVRVDEKTASLLHYADVCFQQSDGLFDITSGVLRRVWDFKKGYPPETKAVEAVLKQIGWQKVVWQDPDFYLPQRGMEVDFGGIGKEYAADRAATLCLEAGLTHGFINLSGDLRVLGPRDDGRPWLVGIRHPRRPGRFIARLPVREGAVATSGDYERFFMHDGRRYHHLLQPNTGWPRVHACQSVTVLAPLCLVAGSATTIAMLKTVTQAREWLQGLGLPYFYLDAEGKQHYGAGMDPIFL